MVPPFFSAPIEACRKFDVHWRVLAADSRVDGHGGSQYRRAYKSWLCSPSGWADPGLWLDRWVCADDSRGSTYA